MKHSDTYPKISFKYTNLYTGKGDDYRLYIGGVLNGIKLIKQT